MATKTIKLKKDHTHEGRDYPPGAVLTMDEKSADWLIGLDVAVAAPKAAQADNGTQS